eukprot:6037305-Alexandrium_andersonii.AAC.1
MAQGLPDWWAVGPVRENSFNLALAQSAQSQSGKLPCYAESDHPVPAPGQPGGAAALMAVAHPQGQGLESLH